MSIWQHSYLTEQPSVSIVFLQQAHFSMQPMTKVQEAFKVWKWAELAVLAGLKSAQFQIAPVP